MSPNGLFTQTFVDDGHLKPKDSYYDLDYILPFECLVLGISGAKFNGSIKFNYHPMELLIMQDSNYFKITPLTFFRQSGTIITFGYKEIEN